MKSLIYKPAIDGLRAFAVLSVILFHFDNTLLPGGFIGVDMFFVISGYIITSVIHSQMQNKSFSFIHFYSKRIKRILPLFYLVAVFSLILAYFLFTPDDFSSFADTLRYSSAFIANIYFEKHSGYFAPTSETMPLLHTWSLSIEEQFYFLWPVILLFFNKYINKKTLIIILSIAVLSGAIYSEYLARTNISQAYYWIQSRAFELLIGATLSVILTKNSKRDNIKSNIYKWFGYLGVICLIMLFFNINKNSLFPGLNALLVVMATCFIITATECTQKGISLFLCHPICVFIGKLSYSLYLWHWPVLAFYRYNYVSFGITGWLVCAFSTIVLSLLSWTFFEKPLRYAKVKDKWVYILYLIIPIIISVSIAKFIAKNEGLPYRYSDEALKVFNISNRTYDIEKLTLPKTNQYKTFEPYIIGDASHQINAFIWGDSHAGYLRSFIDELGKKYQFSALYGGLSGCPPVIGAYIIKYNKEENKCTQKNNDILKQIVESKVQLIFIAARWAVYSETTLSLGEEGSLMFMGEKGEYVTNVKTSRRALAHGLHRAIKQLIKYNKTVILFTQAPDYPYNPSNCIIKLTKNKQFNSGNCDLDEKQIIQRLSYSNKLINSLQKEFPELFVINLSAIICKDGMCRSQINKIPLYHDNDHLNAQGPRVLYSEYIQTKQAESLKKLLLKIKEENNLALSN